MDASESLIAAFALFELGRVGDAAAMFLHGALSFPRAAKILVGIHTSSPRNHDEAVDHSAGIEIQKDLKEYLSGSARKSIRIFKCVFDHPRVSKLLSQMEEVKRRWGQQYRTGEREAFDG